MAWMNPCRVSGWPPLGVFRNKKKIKTTTTRKFKDGFHITILHVIDISLSLRSLRKYRCTRFDIPPSPRKAAPPWELEEIPEGYSGVWDMFYPCPIPTSGNEYLIYIYISTSGNWIRSPNTEDEWCCVEATRFHHSYIVKYITNRSCLSEHCCKLYVFFILMHPQWASRKTRLDSRR